MIRRTATSSTALTGLLERASALLDDGAQRPLSLSRCEPPADPTGTLVEAGWFILQQLQIALGLTVSDAEIDRLVPDVLDRASAFGIASPASVGAAAAIVDHVRSDDAMALARTILAVRGAFGDVELMSAACSLIAALTVQIADGMALDRLVVHDELRHGVVSNIERCESTVRRVRLHRQAAAPRRCVRLHRRRPAEDAPPMVPIVVRFA